MIRVPAYYTTWLFILLMPACLFAQDQKPIFTDVSNGTFAEGLSEGEKPGKLAENHLYRNQGDGTIKNITGTASLAQWISLI